MRYIVIDGNLNGSPNLPSLAHPAVLSIAIGRADAERTMRDHLAGAEGSDVLDVLDGQGVGRDEVHGVRGSLVIYRAMPMPEDDMHR